MKDTIYITGHKIPDSDSICSSIAYSELKRKLGFNSIPIRLGELNRETEFILNYFNIKVPSYVATLKTQVSDLDIDNVIPVSPNISIKTAWMLIKKSTYKTLPVVDDKERLIGILTLSDMTSKYMDILENNIIATSKTPLQNVIETINGKLIFGDQNEYITNGKVVVAAMSPDKMKPNVEKDDIIITGDRKDNQSLAIELGANLLIITGGCTAEKDIIEKAKKNNCVLISTPHDTFTTARLINLSIPIKYVMTTQNIISFNEDDYIDEIRDKMLQTRYRSYPVVNSNNQIKGLISRYHLISQKKKKVIILDHNEISQSIDGIDEAEILEIIDHHRVADIQTGKPIFFRNEPVGSTSTIISNIYFENGIMPSKPISGILCAAILSDTLKFKSPTSTYIDKITAKRLSDIANIDIDTFANEMFKAGTSLKDKTPKEIFYQDFKPFIIGKYKIGIGQVNTMNTDDINGMKDELIKFMEKTCKSDNYDLLMIMLTDIINEGTELLYVGDAKNLVTKAFNANENNNSIYLPGVVSRKQQIVPPLSSYAL